MSLTSSQVDQFHQDGFLAVDNVLTELEMEALHLRLQDIGNRIVDFPEQYIQVEPQVQVVEKATGDPIKFSNVRKIWNLTKYDHLFRTYARQPKIIEMVTQLIGPDLKIFVDQTLCKPPKVGSAKPPHQDSAYWVNIDPPDLVICWMALTPSTIDNGCMRFIPGSHKRGVIEHKHLEDFRVEDSHIDYNSEVAVPLTAGSCTLHHSLVLHRTEPNPTTQQRIGATVAYMSAHSKFIGSSEPPIYDLVSGKSIEGCV
ncbi:MAG: phytanoyl-CoA dioxygenase family protein [Candidatus Poribacteria bacterium]|nr:phytanoyl-CoA dioxygenase family protein [Candidatus Poribacteria bacterium]